MSEALKASNDGSWLNSRAMVLICGVGIFFSMVTLCAKTQWLIEWAVIFTDGLIAAAWTAGACALGAFILRRFRTRANALFYLATAGGMGLGIFSLVGLGLGLLGWLNHITAMMIPAASVLALAIDFLGAHRKTEINLMGWLRGRAGMSWFWLAPVVSLAIVAVAASVMPGQMWKPLDPHPYDVVSYHFQVPREWYEARRIEPLLHNVFSFFPFNVEMQFLMLMHVMAGPIDAMYACQFMSLFYALLMVIGVAGAVSEEGEPAIAAAICAAVPWVMMLGAVGYVESGLLLYTALAVGWAIAPAKDSGGAEMALAGLMAGFACGAKITAVPMLLLAIPIAIFLSSILQRGPKMSQLITRCGIFVAAGLLTLSPWLLRNLFWSGNPIFPVAMNLLGRGHFTLDQVERFRVAHSPVLADQSLLARFRIVWEDVLLHWQYGYVIFPVALAAAAILWRRRETWVLLIIATVMFTVWFGFTHLLPRFLVTLVPVAAILVGNLKWKRAAPLGVLLVVIAGAFGWTGVFTQLIKITHDPDRSVLIGVRGDLSFLVPEALNDARNSDKQVGLVGDAEAFLYQIPMTRLHYRSVFDLPTDTDDPINAWVGAQARGDPNWLLVINPAEIERLHRTYWKTPPLPADWQSPGNQPFVLRGDEVGK